MVFLVLQPYTTLYSAQRYYTTLYSAQRYYTTLHSAQRYYTTLHNPTQPYTTLHNTMALIVPVRGFTPQIGKDCFLAENATIVGDTVIGDGCSIWFNAVLRGDVNWIKIGNHVNIQDGSVLHTLYEKSTITIGDYVSVGHNVTIHGADVHDYALIGMGSTLLDGVVVGEGAIVAAGSLVLKNTQIGPYEVWGGVPAKFIKKADPEQTNEINRKIAHNYAMYASWYKQDEEN